MDTQDYNLRVSEVARAVMHPADDYSQIVRNLRNFIAQNYIPTRHRDPDDKRGAFLLAAPDALIAAVLMRVFATGLHDKEASESVSLRLHAWNPYDFDSAWDGKSPVQWPDAMPRDPAAFIWESWCADPRGAQFTLSLRWWRNVDTGQKLCRGHLHREGDGIMGKPYSPGPDWEITAELVIVLDKLLADLHQRLTVLKKLH